MTINLPEWPAETIAVLTTVDEEPHAIPVTAPVRAGDHRILLSLNQHDASLDRLRQRPEVALTVLAAGDIAFTARGRARILEDAMSQAPQFAAVMIEVQHLDDHRLAAETVAAGVRVEWNGSSAEQGLRERVGALTELARGESRL